MTNKEAISRIKEHMIIHKMNEPHAILITEALNMAIKALGQEPCEDCIRRSDIGLTDFEIVMCNGNYKEALKMLLTKIEKAPSVIPKSAWIPVTERLPEKEGTYLTTIDEYIMTSSYFPNCKHGSKWCPDDVIASDNILAWMPLPEPYKEPYTESEEKKE